MSVNKVTIVLEGFFPTKDFGRHGIFMKLKCKM